MWCNGFAFIVRMDFGILTCIDSREESGLLSQVVLFVKGL
jgi:hypothetical protein